MAAVFDLVILLPLLVALAFGITRLARGKVRPTGEAPAAAGVAAWQPAPPVRSRRKVRGLPFRLIAIAAMALLASIIGLIIASQLGAFDPVIYSPSASQAVGVWKGTHGATIALASDGTFTAAALPAAGVGDWRNGLTPVSGGGTWQVGRFGSSTPSGIMLDFANGSQAELQLESDGSTMALFYDLGDPDAGWSGQYRFVRQ